MILSEVHLLTYGSLSMLGAGKPLPPPVDIKIVNRLFCLSRQVSLPSIDGDYKITEHQLNYRAIGRIRALYAKLEEQYPGINVRKPTDYPYYYCSFDFGRRQAEELIDKVNRYRELFLLDFIKNNKELWARSVRDTKKLLSFMELYSQKEVTINDLDIYMRKS